MDLPKSSSTPMGTLHRPAPTIWLLEFKNGSDNRLTGDMCQQVILPALDIVEKEWRDQWRNGDADVKGARAGALILTGRLDQEKFFR